MMPDPPEEAVGMIPLTEEECAALCYAAAGHPRKEDAKALDRAVDKLLGPATGTMPPDPAPAIRQQERERLEAKALTRLNADLADAAEEAIRQRDEELRERLEAKWQQALDFCLGSVGEYGEDSPEGKAYRNAHTFIQRLANLDSIFSEDDE